MGPTGKIQEGMWMLVLISQLHDIFMLVILCHRILRGLLPTISLEAMLEKGGLCQNPLSPPDPGE